MLGGEHSSENSTTRTSSTNSSSHRRFAKQTNRESWREILVGESFTPKVRRRSMPTRSDDPQALQELAARLGTRDPKTIATYLTTVRDFVTWLALQPPGAPRHLLSVSQTSLPCDIERLGS